MRSAPQAAQPDGWGAPWAWPSLKYLNLSNNLLRRAPARPIPKRLDPSSKPLRRAAPQRLPAAAGRRAARPMPGVSAGRRVHGLFLPAAASMPWSAAAAQRQCGSAAGSPQAWTWQAAWEPGTAGGDCAPALTAPAGGGARRGALPEEFSAQGGCAPMLTELRLDRNALTGTLPAAWGNASMWPQLQLMNLTGNPLTGANPLRLTPTLPQPPWQPALAAC